MVLIVGLGNPGKKFENSRHNLGFKVIDAIKESYNFPSYKKKFMGCLSVKKIFNTKIFLLKPHTYMNLSGNSVENIVNFHQIATENIIVFHDDIDMEFKKIRVKRNGGHGGHNGIRNIISRIGKEFYRIKIGIKDEEINIDMKDFVLKKFSKSQNVEITNIIGKIAENFESVVKKDFISFNNRIV